jgi:hypothetical protein
LIVTPQQACSQVPLGVLAGVRWKNWLWRGCCFLAAIRSVDEYMLSNSQLVVLPEAALYEGNACVLHAGIVFNYSEVM